MKSGIKVGNKLTCPQCGAPIEDDKCPYCGVVFYDFACIDTRKPFYLKIKRDDNIYICLVKMDTAEVKMSNNDVSLWADDALFACISDPQVDIDMHFHVVDKEI